MAKNVVGVVSAVVDRCLNKLIDVNNGTGW